MDSAGEKAFTDPQVHAINDALNPQTTYSRYRGTQIDHLSREFVEGDPHLSHLHGLKNNGPDFIDPNTGHWWDMTTEREWPKKIPKYREKYGPDGHWLSTD